VVESGSKVARMVKMESRGRERGLRAAHIVEQVECSSQVNVNDSSSND
jgi:hypothetical protein